MTDLYGASPDAWRLWSETLGLTEDMLPVVSNPNAQISPTSSMKALGKTPSRYNTSRKVAGFPEWTQHKATVAEIERWAVEPDYGVCIQTRRLRAIDIDVEDAEQVKRILGIVFSVLGANSRRWRDDSEKCLIPFWFDGDLFKHVVPVDGGMIEILGEGQQFIADGTHVKGARYQWHGRGFPTLTAEQFALLMIELGEIATGEIRIARGRRDKRASIESDDEVAKFLVDNWETYDVGADGQIFIACPFGDQHSTDSGPTSTAYFPSGSGGYVDGNFVCLHAHCTGRGQAEFLNATGFTSAQFGSVDGGNEIAHEPAPHRGDQGDSSGAIRPTAASRADTQALILAERWPGGLVRDSTGKLEPTMSNLVKAIGSPAMVHRYVAWDTFKDALVRAEIDRPWADAQWHEFRDTDYAHMRVELEGRGFKPFGMEMMRLAVLTVAEGQQIDTAVEWLNRLTWDGVGRMASFCVRGWGWTDSAYSRAVGRYVWTALAGRVLEPGVQADMAPILVGVQGARKTTAIKAMAPAGDFYAEIQLGEKEADLSRKMRGVLVGELEELRGLKTRELETIKAFISRDKEKWIPKFREFATDFKRRLLFFGSTNETELLADATGERRWLPGHCHGGLDIDWIRAQRDQLWAEGAALFNLDGVDWQDAERLAVLEHPHFRVPDPWEGPIARWLTAEAFDVSGAKPGEMDWLTGAEIAAGALGIQSAALDRAKEIRIGKAMGALGWVKGRAKVADAEGRRGYGFSRAE